jgi:rRNA maturation RNase YbeY
MEIRFFFPYKKIFLPQRSQLKAFIKSLCKKEGYMPGTITFIFCSDETLLEMNRQFLNHNYYTDILTFDLSEQKGEITGEIYISIDRVRDNANSFGKTFKEEIHRVIFHGVLHLCGNKDKTAKESVQMRQKEDYYLSRYL